MLMQGLLQLQAWVYANGVLKDCMIKVYLATEYRSNIKISEEKYKLIILTLSTPRPGAVEGLDRCLGYHDKYRVAGAG